uniref:PDZ domain-containing protein n=1 Tax=Anas platyrhynchos platyrhynchos TaxID=8840 RepID=A0A493TMB8_ANAPP
MSKGLKKKSHWTSRVHEIVIVRNPEGQLGFELKGGAENGQFPYLGEVKPGKVAYEGGSKLVPEELLLEVNETPVAGLTIRDVLAVIKHCKDPIRLKCVKQGKAAAPPAPSSGEGGGGGDFLVGMIFLVLQHPLLCQRERPSGSNFLCLKKSQCFVHFIT